MRNKNWEVSVEPSPSRWVVSRLATHVPSEDAVADASSAGKCVPDAHRGAGAPGGASNSFSSAREGRFGLRSTGWFPVPRGGGAKLTCFLMKHNR